MNNLKKKMVDLHCYITFKFWLIKYIFRYFRKIYRAIKKLFQLISIFQKYHISILLRYEITIAIGIFIYRIKTINYQYYEYYFQQNLFLLPIFHSTDFN